ncbi:MAG: hypothetical protein R3264_06970, partial [Anaerolineae bacterium]|nr:hypothetical protein [Anaerolineae bacterium]
TYRVKMTEKDKNCLPPARNEPKPDLPFRTYGEFQVEVFDTGEDRDDDAWYGIFINGQGGDNYYLFRVRPNANGCTTGGNWELRRRRNGSETVLANASCVSALKRGYGSGAKNTLKIVHKSDRTLTLFINGVQVFGPFTENASQHLTGTATGIYVRSDNQIIRIKFDNFLVNKFQ